MIGVLRPKQPLPSAGKEHARFPNGGLIVRAGSAAAQRYWADSSSCPTTSGNISYEDYTNQSRRYEGGTICGNSIGRNDEHPCFSSSPGGIVIPILSSVADGEKLTDLGTEVGNLCVAVVRQSFPQASRSVLSTETPPSTASSSSNKTMKLLRFLQSSRNRHHREASLVLYMRLPGAIAAFPLGSPVFRLQEDFPHQTIWTREATYVQHSMSWTLPVQGFEALLNMEQSIAPGLSTLARDMEADEHFEKDATIVSTGTWNKQERTFIVVPRMLGIAIVNLPVHHGPRGTLSTNAAATTAGGSRAAAVVARLEHDGKSARSRLILEPRDVRLVDGNVFFPCGSKTYTEKTRVSFPTTYAVLLAEARLSTSTSPRFRFSWLAKWSRLRCRQGQPSSSRIVPGIADSYQPEVEKQFFIRETREDDSQGRKQYSCSEETGDCSQWNRPIEVVGMEPRHLTADRVRSSSLTTITSWALTPHFVRELLLAAATQEKGKAMADDEMRGDDGSLVHPCCAEARDAACAILTRVLGEAPNEKRKPGDAAEFARQSSIVMDQWYTSFLNTASLREGDAKVFHGSVRLLLEDLLAIPGVKAGFLQRGLLRRLSNSLRITLSKSLSSERACHVYSGYAGLGDSMLSHPGGDKCFDAIATKSGTFGESDGLQSGDAEPFRVDLSAQRKPTDIPWWLLQCDLVSSSDCSGSAVVKGDGDTHDNTDLGEGCEIPFRESLVPQGDESIPPTSRDAPRIDEWSEDHAKIYTEESGTMLVSPPSDGAGILKQARSGKTDTGDKEGSVTRERVAPPMLRLDMLDHALGDKEGVSPRRSSRVGAIALSAASTRVLARLPTFRSVRGATSRASACHGSGRSVRTGPTTQRDLVSPGWLTGRSSCSPPLADQEPPLPSSPSSVQARAGDLLDETLAPNSRLVYGCGGHCPGVQRGAPRIRDNSTSRAEELRSSDGIVDTGRLVSGKALPSAPVTASTRLDEDTAHEVLEMTSQISGTNPLQQTINRGGGLREPVEYAVSASAGVRQSSKTSLHSAFTAGLTTESGAYCARGLCSDNLSADLVLRIAYASAPSVGPSPMSRQNRQTPRQNKHDGWADMIAASKLLLSLLSSSAAASREIEIEEALGVALDVFLTRSVWSQNDAPSSRTDSTTINRHSFGGGPEAQGRKSLTSFPPEFDSIDIIPLSKAIFAALQSIKSRLRLHFESGRDGAYGDVASDCHQQWVYRACILSLESARLTGLLLKRVVSLVSNPGEQRLSSPSKEVIECVLPLCGRALREPFLSSSSSISSGDDVSRTQGTILGDATDDCFESTGAFLLLNVPGMVNVASTFTLLLQRASVWGDDLLWSGHTLRMIVLGGDRSAVSVLTALLKALVASNKEENSSGGSPLRLPIRTCSGYDTTRELARNLTGDTHAVDELLKSIVQSLSAVLQRSNTLLDTYRDLRWSNRVSTPLALLRLEDNSTGTPMSHGKSSYSIQARKNPAGTVVHVTTEDRGDKTTGYDLDTLNTLGTDLEDSLRRIENQITPAFRPRGSLHALLLAMPLARNYSEGDENGRLNEPSVTGYSCEDYPGVITSAPLLAATLYLSTLVFVVQEKRTEEIGTDDEDDQRGTLEIFATSVFSAFVCRYNKILSNLKGMQGQNQGASNKTGQRKTDDGEILLCRLHLDVIARFAASREASVRERVWERRVVQFLFQHFFEPGAVGIHAGGSLGCAETAIESSDNNSEASENSPHVALGIKDGTDEPTATRGNFLCSRALENKEERNLADDTAEEEGVGSISITPFALVHNNTSIVSDGLHRGKLSNGLRTNLRESQEVNSLSGTAKEDKEALFVAGDKIDGFVAFRQKRSRWFPGCVERTNADGSLYICYDNGDEERAKPRHEVRPRRKRSERAWRQSSALSRVRELTARAMDVGSSNDVQQSVVLAGAPDTIDCAGKEQHEVSIVEESTGCRSSMASVTCSIGDPPAYTGATTSSIDAEATGRFEDDDMYFVIPSALKAKPAAPASAIPKINLQLADLRSRVRSSQLRPVSSLSTPMIAGGSEKTLLRRGGSRSEASLASFDKSQAVNHLLTAMDPSSPSLLTPRNSSTTPSASTLVSVHAEVLPSGYFGVSDSREDSSGITGKLFDRECDAMKERVHAALVGRGERNGGDMGRRVEERELNVDEAPIISGVGRTWLSRRSRNELRKMRLCAVATLLTLVSSPQCYDRQIMEWGQSSPSSFPSELSGGRDLLADAMTRLQLFFEDPRNDDLVASLITQWSSKSTWKAAPAMLMKLVCAALFDAQSYSLDGQHIASGSFGGVVVSRSPLPLRPLVPTARHRVGSGTSISRPRNNNLTPFSTSNIPVRQKQSRRDEVALKLIDKNNVEGQSGTRVFFEVLALQTLSDVPGVCRLYDFGVTPTAYVLVMERCRVSVKGWRAARDRIAHGNSDHATGASELSPRSEQEAALYLLMFRQVVTAVTAIGEKGVIHLDLKCDNVLVRDETWDASSVAPRGLSRCVDLAEIPCVCVADFGEAVIGSKREFSPSGVDTTPTSSDPFEFNVRSARGTEHIQSPEMIVLTDCDGSGRGRGGRDLDVPRDSDQDRPKPSERRTRKTLVGRRAAINSASDVWSLGCLLYELLTGKFLFDDMPWSEFFVRLTAGEDVVDHASVQETTGTSVLPSLALRPFSRLVSAGIIRTLLESILVRDSVKRPKASRVIQSIDEALNAISAQISEHSVNDVTEQTASTLSEARRAEGFDGCETLSRSALNPIHKRETEDTTRLRKSEAPCGSSHDVSMWPLRPCLAVIAQQRLAQQRLAEQHLSESFDCAGCLHRLGAGAFLLTLTASKPPCDAIGSMAAGECDGFESGDEARCNVSRAEQSKAMSLSLETPVVCLPDFAEWVEAVEGCHACEGGLPCSLGNVLPVLGVTHVVCVTTTKEEHHRVYKRVQSACCGYSSSSDRLGGCQLLNILLPADGMEDDRKCCRSSSGGISPSVVCVRDVLAFATGLRVLFVGFEGNGQGTAGALAMAWAMSRTGKGSFETMLEFRQSCAGFWVKPRTLQTVLGFGL